MRALGSNGKPKSERTAGQSTSAHRDVAQETYSVNQETRGSRGSVESTPELSGGEESDSDFAPEELSQTPLERRKKQIVDNAMVIVMQCLDKAIPPKRHSHGDSSSVRSHGAAAAGGRSTKTTESHGNDDKENATPQWPRKRLRRDDRLGGNGDGNSGRGGNGNKRAKKETKKTFACPFYKHNPRKYRSKTCKSGEFPTPARVKEHIYRTHLNSLICPRCGSKFGDEQAREAHLRADDVCEKKDLAPLDGVTKAQERKLRVRPKRGDSEEEQWFSIYKIIFPDTPEDSLPHSPYCEDHESQTLEGMHEYVRRELPRVVRRQLEQDIERSLNDKEKEYRETIMRLLPQFTRRLIEIYRGDMGPLEDETLGPAVSDVTIANSSEPPGLADKPFDELERFDDIDFNFEDLVSFPGFQCDILDGY